MDFIKSFDFISPETAKIYLNISLTLLVTILLNNFFRSLIKVPKSLDTKRAQTYAAILRNFLSGVIYTIALYTVFIILNIDLTPLLTSASIIGIALGIGARPLIEDLIAGLSLLSQKSIGIGDYVRIDDAEGVIETFGMRALTIRTDTGALYIIPNGQIKKLINFSRHKTRVLVIFPVKVTQNVDKVLTATEAALTALEKDKSLENDLYPGSTVDGIDDFRIEGLMNIRTVIVTSPSRRDEVARKFRYHLKKEFEKKKLLFK